MNHSFGDHVSFFPGFWCCKSHHFCIFLCAICWFFQVKPGALLGPKVIVGPLEEPTVAELATSEQLKQEPKRMVFFDVFFFLFRCFFLCLFVVHVVPFQPPKK